MKTFSSLAIRALFSASMLVAQNGSPVNVSVGPPVYPWTTLMYYDGSSNLEYVCRAQSVQPTSTFAVSGSTPFVLTSIVVSANVGTVTTVSDHGLAVNQKVVVSGATGDTDLNATYLIATVPTTKTYTVATVSVSNGTYNNAGLQFTTTAPRNNVPIWSIEKLTYSGTTVTQVQWANGSSGASVKCSERATTPFN